MFRPFKSDEHLVGTHKEKIKKYINDMIAATGITDTIREQLSTAIYNEVAGEMDAIYQIGYKDGFDSGVSSDGETS